MPTAREEEPPRPSGHPRLPVRRLAREWALQVLYQYDLGAGEPEPAALEALWERLPEETEAAMTPTESRKVRRRAEGLVTAVRERQDEIDELIQRHADNWTVPRMATIDRNIMRIAVAEMLSAEDVPPAVSINEAIDIAKAYGDTNSGRFVNAILDRVHHALESQTP